MSARNNHLEVSELLIRHGADVNSKNKVMSLDLVDISKEETWPT